MYVTHLECSKTGKTYEPNKLYNLSEAGKPLLVRYDPAKAARTLTKESLKNRVSSLWRYREVLPVVKDENIITLGEGWTPLIHAERLGEKSAGAVVGGFTYRIQTRITGNNYDFCFGVGLTGKADDFIAGHPGHFQVGDNKIVSFLF